MVNENEFLLHSLLMGVFITYVYDLLRIFRRVIPHGSFLVSLEDFVFWVYCGIEVFLLMYHESDGTLRWFAVIGALAGMVSYKKLISPFLVKYVSLVLNKLLSVIGKVLKWLCRPFCFLLGKAGHTAHRAGGKLGVLFRRIRRRIRSRVAVSLKVLRMNLKKVRDE
jgi:spore cortex biosynthesis protein YabQ